MPIDPQHKQTIIDDLNNNTGTFCAAFHSCADEYLEHPEKIPKRIQKKGTESKYITQKCMMKVFSKVIDLVF